MRIAKDDLSLDELIVIYPGSEEFPLSRDGIRAVGLDKFVFTSHVT